MKMRYLFLLIILSMPCRAADNATPLLPVDDPIIQRDLQAISQKVSTLLNPLNISSGAITTLTSSTATITTLSGVTSINGSFPNPNILINGGFEFWQRKSSSTGTADSIYVADRWIVSTDEATNVTISTETTTIDLGAYSAKILVTVAGASTNWNMIQKVENWADYKGKTVSLSVRVWANTASAIRVRVTDGVTNSFSSYHSGGSGWETLTATLNVSASNDRLNVFIGMLADGDKRVGTYYLDSAMFVVGNQPVGFIPMNLEKELAMCQRYFWRLGGEIADQNWGVGQVYTTTDARFIIQHPVTMRISPTKVVLDPAGSFYLWRSNSATSPATFSINNMGANRTGISAVTPTAVLTAGNATIFGSSATASAITFDAEL